MKKMKSSSEKRLRAVEKEKEEELRKEEEEEEFRRKMERERLCKEEEEEVASNEFEEEAEERDAKRKEDELYCVACRKKFKSEKQWVNHDQSKKHHDKLAMLKERVTEDVPYKIHKKNIDSNKRTTDNVDDLSVDELNDDQIQELQGQRQIEFGNAEIAPSQLSILRKRAGQRRMNVKASGSSKRKKQSVRRLMVFAFLFFFFLLVILSFYFPFNL